MDGSTSDVDWNRRAIEYLTQLVAADLSVGIYVADAKMVTEENIRKLGNNSIQFVSRCPVNFNDHLQYRMIDNAYEIDQFEDIGTVTEGSKANSYRGMSIIEEIYGIPMRLLVLESESLQRIAQKSLEKTESRLEVFIKTQGKKEYTKREAAEKAKEAFLSNEDLMLYDCEVEIGIREEEKWPKGRRGPDTKPEVVETYFLNVISVTLNEQRYDKHLQRESCLVLISNIVDEYGDEELLKIYKGQQTVENSFKYLKGPSLASVIYLKNPNRIEAMTMLLTVVLLIRAIIQYRLREGLRKHEEDHPKEVIRAGWQNKPLKNPTFKLIHEHSINCYFERKSKDQYLFEWPSDIIKFKVETYLKLMGITLQELLE
jgi:transposase